MLRSDLLRKYNIKNLQDLDGAVLFGCGKLGVLFSEFFKQNGLKIRAFSDNNATFYGKRVNGIEVVDANKVVDLGCPIIITSRYSREISHSLKSKTIPHFVLTYLFPKSFPETYYKHVDIKKDQKEIEKIRNLLSDKKSKDLYDKILLFRKTMSLSDMPRSEGPEKYFLEKKFPIGDHETIVDVGAFDGDTIKSWLELRGNKFEKYVALEPDPITYKQMLKAIPKNLKDKFEPICAGAGVKKQTLRFSGGGRLDSAIDRNGDQEVEIISLDSLKSIPTIIKMDVEGFESRVLRGARNTIAKYKPKLCLSVYHKSNDLWKLPLQVLSYNSNYKKLYLRQYGEGLIETTLYMF